MTRTRVHTMPYACLHCRKAFKKPIAAGNETYACPDCSQPMTMMGTAFRAPKQSNLEQWQKVRLLVEAGFMFHRNSGPKPRRLKDVPEFLEAHRLAHRSPGERLLEELQQRVAGAKTPVTKAKAQGRVKRLNTEGRPRFELQGRELTAWSRVLVRVNGEWHEGHFRFTGDGGKPVEPHVRLNNRQYVFITANTVLRWPDE